jgi:hypothetical protein
VAKRNYYPLATVANKSLPLTQFCFSIMSCDGLLYYHVLWWPFVLSMTVWPFVLSCLVMAFCTIMSCDGLLYYLWRFKTLFNRTNIIIIMLLIQLYVRAGVIFTRHVENTCMTASFHWVCGPIKLVYPCHFLLKCLYQAKKVEMSCICVLEESIIPSVCSDSVAFFSF